MKNLKVDTLVSWCGHAVEGCIFENILAISFGKTASYGRSLIVHEVIFQRDPIVLIIHKIDAAKVSETGTLTEEKEE